MAVINGTAGFDILSGTPEADFLNGFDGDDRLRSSLGADAMNGGDGIDRVDYLFSTAGVRLFLDNTQAATGGYAAGDFFISIENAAGSEFDDEIHGGNGTDNTLTGGAGDDILKGLGGDDTLIGDAGADSFDGGAGTDTVSYFGASSGVRVFLASGGGGGEAQGDRFQSIENLSLTSHNDIGVGDAGDNVISGENGDDLLFGDPSTGPSGNDSLVGGDGADALWGRGGDDRLQGGPRDDTLIGGAGFDQLSGGSGADILFGGDFTAQGAFATGSGWDFLNGDEGDDVIWGFDGDDTIDLGAGGGQTTSFQYADGGEGNDSVRGGANANAYLIGGAGNDAVGGHLGGIDFIWGDDPANPGTVGADNFNFRLGASFDQIFDFGAGDRLRISNAFGVPTLADFIYWATFYSGGADTGYTIFTSYTGLDQLIVHGRSASSWTAANFEVIV